MNSFDARVRYTRMVIEENFLKLLEEKPVYKITVTELCRRCQINRATFYKHYLDVPDLLEKLEERLFEQIRSAFRDQAVGMEAFLTDMLNFMRQEGMRFMVLGSDNGDPGLMAKTFTICYENAYPILEKNIPNISEERRQMLYHFLTQGSGGILTHWIKTGMTEEPENVVSFIMQVCSVVVAPFNGG